VFSPSSTFLETDVALESVISESHCSAKLYTKLVHIMGNELPCLNQVFMNGIIKTENRLNLSSDCISFIDILYLSKHLPIIG
jgi:hypothetical protein